MSRRARSFGSAILLFSQLSTLLLGTVVNAQQAFQPAVTIGATATFVDGQAMYILGGATQNNTPSTQAFEIDFTVSWEAASPAVKKLPDGPATWSTGSTLTADKKNWFVLVNGTGYLYNIQSSTWSTALPSTGNINKALGLSAVTDPDSGIIYVPNGYIDSKNKTSLLAIDLTNKNVGSIPMYSNLNTSRLYSTSWNVPLKSMLYVSETADALYSYNTANGWSHLNATGDIPTPRVASCLVSAYGGSQMILFGGYSRINRTSLNDIYILDVATLNWKQGTDVDITDRRDSTACAASTEYFVAWGGVATGEAQDVPSNGTVLLYHIKTATWTTNYVSILSSSVASSAEARNLYMIGSILGIVVGVLLLVGALIYYFRLKHTKKSKHHYSFNEKGDYPSDLHSSHTYGHSRDSLV